MSRRVISTSKAPAAIGPYSQAIASGGWVFASGQIPIDVATGKLVPGDVRAQTRQVMNNLGEVLTAAGASLRDVVKTTIYLCDLADFKAVNEIYADAFATTTGGNDDSWAPPARATVQVAALPLGARVEIDAVAVIDSTK